MAEPLQQITQPAGAAAAARVMVADSHPLVVEALHNQVALQGDLTLLAPIGDLELVATAVEREKPDVTLLGYDLWRPEAARLTTDQIRVLAKHTHLVLIYDRIDPHQAWQALHAGAAGMLSRVSPVTDFARAIRHVLHGGTFLDAEIQDEIALLARHESDPGAIMLSPREQTVLQLGADGLTTEEIAQRIRLSASSVKLLLHEIYRKLNVRDRPAAVAQALRRGLIT